MQYYCHSTFLDTFYCESKVVGTTSQVVVVKKILTKYFRQHLTSFLKVLKLANNSVLLFNILNS